MLEFLKTDTSPFSICPHDWAPVERMCASFEMAMLSSGNPRTVHKDQLHVAQYWAPFCRSMNTPEWRTDASIQQDTHALLREQFIIYLFIMYIKEEIQPRKLADRRAGRSAKPSSIIAPVGAMRRQHKLKGLKACLPSLPDLGAALCGMEREYIAVHGPDSLIPERKYAMRPDIVAGMLSAPDGTRISGDTVNWSTLKWRSVAAAIATCDSTGFRKAEIGCSALQGCHLMRSSLFWCIAGEEVYVPSTGQMLSPDTSYVACIANPPSKADFSNKLHGFYPSYMRWRSDCTAAAYQLALLELHFPVPAHLRASTPLFQVSFGVPFSLSQLDNIMAGILRWVASVSPEVLRPEHVSRYSWHSFRRGLASRLVKLGVPVEHIQRICRWATPESLKQYGILDIDEYSRLVEQANRTSVQSIHVTRAAPLVNPAELRHYTSLLDRAHGLSFTNAHANAAYAIHLDNDDAMMDMSELALEVERLPD